MNSLQAKSNKGARTRNLQALHGGTCCTDFEMSAPHRFAPQARNFWGFFVLNGSEILFKQEYNHYSTTQRHLKIFFWSAISEEYIRELSNFKCHVFYCSYFVIA